MRNNSSEISKKICIKIKLERVKRDWSQEELAENSKLSVNTIGRIERCQISPTIDTVVKISEAMNISFTKLMDISDI